MAEVDHMPNELEKLLADVQRTIRENNTFIRSLKKEAVESEEGIIDNDIDGDGGYEEL
jgi:hypothetical protein